MTETAPRIHRRRFLQQAGIGVGLFHIVPAHVLGGPKYRAPSDKLNVACIGVGGRGSASVRACKDENIIALCDVDDKRAAKSYEQFPSARRYRDFREMLDALDKDIDAVTVGTPDHTHAVAALDAIRRGKHVYCEKPLAHSIHEVRALMDAARKQTVVTQLGNQGHSFDDIRTFCEWIQDGAIGNVKEIHACCESFGDVFSQIDKLPQLAEKHEAGSDFHSYGGPLTEVALVGAVAIRFPGRELEWDAKAMQFTNVDEANATWRRPTVKAGVSEDPPSVSRGHGTSKHGRSMLQILPGGIEPASGTMVGDLPVISGRTEARNR